MKHEAHTDLRRGVLISLLAALVVVLASLDPSCQPRNDIPHAGPRRSIAP